MSGSSTDDIEASFAAPPAPQPTHSPVGLTSTQLRRRPQRSAFLAQPSGLRATAAAPDEHKRMSDEVKRSLTRIDVEPAPFAYTARAAAALAPGRLIMVRTSAFWRRRDVDEVVGFLSIVDFLLHLIPCTGCSLHCCALLTPTRSCRLCSCLYRRVDGRTFVTCNFQCSCE